jgi:hypothetical protein
VNFTRHASESWHPCFFAGMDPSPRWGDALFGAS